ncbi:MAG: hypothetical protein J5554_12740 [Paludibacteraceae bacterium]|nr:hypothetical protein [Paludibacteraceae bacterium]
MAEINVYQRFFEAEFEYNDVKRRAASVWLISNSEAGQIKYEVALSFIPHEDDEDFRVSYDAYFTKTIYESSGRRSKKKEKDFLESLPGFVDGMADEVGGKVFWDRPLSDERLG